MADTNMNAFVNSCAGFVQTSILAPIVQHLVGKGYQVTMEELVGVLQLPATRAPSTPVMPAPAVPSMAFGAVPQMTAAVAPTTAARKTTATATPVQGRTCVYQFKRGEHKGKYCGKATSPGEDHCKGCQKSRKLGPTVGTGVVPGVAPGTGAIPSMAGVPAGYATPVNAASSSSAPQGGQLSVLPYDDERGLYREPNHNFIVCERGPGVIAVVGRLIEAENRIVALTDQEKVTAQNIGLVLTDAQQAPPVTAVTAAPAAIPAVVPSIPTAVPSIPAAIPTVVPATQPGLIHTGQAALPTITPLTTTASTPGTGVPQIPGIPQITM